MVQADFSGRKNWKCTVPITQLIDITTCKMYLLSSQLIKKHQWLANGLFIIIPLSNGLLWSISVKICPRHKDKEKKETHKHFIVLHQFSKQHVNPHQSLSKSNLIHQRLTKIKVTVPAVCTKSAVAKKRPTKVTCHQAAVFDNFGILLPALDTNCKMTAAAPILSRKLQNRDKTQIDFCPAIALRLVYNAVSSSRSHCFH